MQKIKYSKGNIPINKKLLNKYSNVGEIFNNETNDFNNLTNISTFNINIKEKNITEVYHLATKLFKSNHKRNTFINNGNEIKVTNQDIKESINKIANDKMQNKYLKEHLVIFTDLGNIIQNARLVNQTIENKNRLKYNIWNYYFNGLKINNILFDLEIDVVSRSDGENHYRIQRLKEANTLSTLPINGEVDLGAFASSKNNIP